jgi:mycothiol synthase
MEIALGSDLSQCLALSPGYHFISWHSSLLDIHADTKWQSFRLEIDANVFPCLADREGCRRLMTEISRRDGFLPEATWLIQYSENGGRTEYVGTIQGLIDHSGVGAIQNIGVTTDHRGRGLGSLLVWQALEGFRDAGLSKAYLEVTAQNVGAIRLYERLGFRKVKTVYKTAEVAYA